ncbi:MAG TPA: C40 family peptidase [Acidimicrobiales bacterium]
MNAAYRPRTARAVVAAVLTAALITGGSGAALATQPAPPAGSAAAEAPLRAQAQELAGQIEADGRNLDQMAEALDAAQIRNQQMTAQLGVLHAAMARTDAQATAAKAALKEEALLAYLAGGAPLITTLPSRTGSDPSLTVSYAQIVAGGQRRAVANYRTVLADQTRQARQLTDAQRQAAATVVELSADRTAAAGAAAARRVALARITGQLATLVAQVQSTQQQAEQAAVKTDLARQGQLPPVLLAPSTTAATTAVAQRPAPSPTTAASTATAPPAPPATTPTTTPPPPTSGNVAASGSATAVHYAYAQLGKPYQWAGAGPGSFDCSGLTMMAWEAAGVYLPHLAQDQYNLTRRIPLSDVLPGDLIFFGTPDDVYHVGISIGGGEMIDAPATGQVVSISSIYWADLLGAGRIID